LFLDEEGFFDEGVKIIGALRRKGAAFLKDGGVTDS
jgi:hypothetical protein